jgi:hypothetical protein
MKILVVGDANGRTDMTKLTVAFPILRKRLKIITQNCSLRISVIDEEVIKSAGSPSFFFKEL